MHAYGYIPATQPQIPGEGRLSSALDKFGGPATETVAGIILNQVVAEFGTPVRIESASTILDEALATFGAPMPAASAGTIFEDNFTTACLLIEDSESTTQCSIKAEDETTTNCPTNDDDDAADGSPTEELAEDGSESTERPKWRPKSHRLCKVKRERLNKLARRLAAMEPVELSAELRANEFLMNKLRNKVKQHQASNAEAAASSAEQPPNQKESLWPCDNLAVGNGVAADPAAEWTHTVGWMQLAMSGW
eukprot:CAMPEP_0172910796 /NCGR_PEP_ID=MMETSP1075-20121228/185319_1 /TAXON_ID=2916 /ORGANISM="Ceratium fusus, Strain PA161109" /LENGTH=249 /DNA_ID=CAMNT_0013768989 /DNA_START=26 /DNA_END=772 /DNA_ORIENTATION=-